VAKQGSPKLGRPNSTRAQSDQVIKEADLQDPRAGLKRGVWGESRLGFFKSIVEDVRRFVASMPPVDSTAGLDCCPRSFSALGDQRAEILPLQRPPVLSAGGRCTMRLTRILMFPFFSLSILDQLPLHRGAFHNAQKTSLETGAGYTRLTGQSTYCSEDETTRGSSAKSPRVLAFRASIARRWARHDSKGETCEAESQKA
jgi:hypothetical protein